MRTRVDNNMGAALLLPLLLMMMLQALCHLV